MKRLILPIALATFQLCVLAQTPTPRPKILGIDHVSFYTTAPDGVKKLYAGILGLAASAPIEPNSTVRYMVGTQWVGYSIAPESKATDRMGHVAFTTDNIVALRRYLTEKGIKVSEIEGRADHSLSLTVTDPEGRRIEFVERVGRTVLQPSSLAVSHDSHRLHRSPSRCRRPFLSRNPRVPSLLARRYERRQDRLDLPAGP